MICRTKDHLYGVFRKKKYIPLIFGIGYVFHVFVGEVIQRQELSNAQQQLFISTPSLTEEMEVEEDCVGEGLELEVETRTEIQFLSSEEGAFSCSHCGQPGK